MNRLVDAKASRREMDIDSVKALAEFLRKVAAAPDDFKADAKLLAALRSQGSLAKHAVPEASVHSMSLNHQRLIAQIALGDYVSLDSLRRVALNALKSEELSFQRSNKQSKAGLAAQVKKLEGVVELLKRDLALLQLAYDRRCIQARNYATLAGAVTVELCTKEQKELDVIFSLRQRPKETENVVLLDTVRKNGPQRL